MANEIEGDTNGQPLKLDYPHWFHPYGSLMRVKAHHTRGYSISLADPHKRVEVLIKKASTINPVAEGWQIKWKIRHGTELFVEADHGTRHFSDFALEAAFGLVNYTGAGEEHFAKRYDADCAIPGMFIRKGNFLNIPGPGTGKDGDPNVSVYLTDEVKDAIRDLTKLQ